MSGARWCGAYGLLVAAGFAVAACGSAESDGPAGVSVACAAGTWAQDGKCVPWQDCAAGSFVVKEGSGLADRECSPCAAGRYSASVNASDCELWTDCAENFVETTAPSPALDRSCEEGDWMDLFGTHERDIVLGLAVDPQGNVFAGGHTAGALPGQKSGGWNDAFLRKYAPGGKLLWTQQWGTEEPEYVYGVVMDSSGDVFVVWSTDFQDTTIERRTSDGDLVWSVPANMGYLASGPAIGRTGELALAGVGPSDSLLLRMFSNSGEELWSVETPAFGACVAIDAEGNAVVAGSWAFGHYFVQRLTPMGDVLWTYEVDDGTQDDPRGLAVDPEGNIYVLLRSNVDGAPFHVFKLSPDGALQWTSSIPLDVKRASAELALVGADVYLAVKDLGDPTLLRIGPDGTSKGSQVLEYRLDNIASIAAGPSGALYLGGVQSPDWDTPEWGGGGDAFVVRVKPQL